MKITKSQQERINYFKEQMLKRYSLKHRNDYELKKCEVSKLSQCLDTIVLYVESGLIGDEGTMAELYGRDIIHIFIGRNGKVEYVEKGKVKIFNMSKDSIWTLVVANQG